MRIRFVYCIFVLFLSQQLFCQSVSEKVIVGSFHTREGNEMHDVTLSIIPSLEPDYRVSISFYKGEGYLIALEKNINRFYSYFKYISDKYTEWEKVARDNNVTDFNKAIEIDSPPCIITSKKGTSLVRTENPRMDCQFVVRGADKYIRISSLLYDENGYVIDTMYLFFYSPTELQSLVRLLNTDTLHSKALELRNKYGQSRNAKSQQSDLFR